MATDAPATPKPVIKLIKVTVEEVIDTGASYDRDRTVYTQYVAKADLDLGKLIAVVNKFEGV